jgi:LuxR family maltose regulon positive regulatory protein
MKDYPAVAVLAGLVFALTGKPADAERWARAAEQAAVTTRLPDWSPSLRPWLALLRALLCRDGVAQMQADAELAAATMDAGSFWQTAATLYLRMAHLMAADPDRADDLFAEAITKGLASGVTVGPCVALAERSLLAVAHGKWEIAERYLDQARTLAREANLEDQPPVTIVHAAAARIALHRGDQVRARRELARAQRLRPALTYAVPHLAVQARLELAAAHLALGEPDAARTLLREIDEILSRRPDLGVFGLHVRELRAQVAGRRPARLPGASALSAAELRVLPFLSTHLSFPEIGEELFVSRNTIRSQVYSIYRKLGVSSRTQAVAESRRLGLLDT